jgi:hypothetical protein
MSQPMNFSPLVQQLSGGELPLNSINLVYSPSCPHCHNIMPQYNQLPGLSGGKFSVNAVNLMDHYHELRAGGVQVGGVPQILIRGGSTELMEYNGPRMADSIAKEAIAFIDGQLAGGSTPSAATETPIATETPSAMESTDALLGGAAAQAQDALTGGKKRGPKKGSHHRKHKSKSRSKGRRHHHMRGGSVVTGEALNSEITLEGGSRRRHHRMRGGSTLTGEASEVLVGGRSRKHRSRSRSSRSRSRSRRHRHHMMMRGGSTIEGGETPSVSSEVTFEGGKAKKGRRGSHLGKWRRHVMAYAKQHNMSLKKAMSKARASYYK